MDDHVLRTYARTEVEFTHGDGAVLYDHSGEAYLDFLGGIAVSALGHAHPGLTAALRDQVGRLLHTSNLYRHPYTDEVANRLASLSGLDAVFFSNSGAEANEAALKIARKHQRQRGAEHRTAFVALEGGFHGRTLGALSVTHNEAYRAPFAPLLPHTTFVPFGDTEALERALQAEPAALILEPIQGESGVRVLPDAYLRRARQLCSATETVLIHDEVQAGCGRTGSFLSAEIADVLPDIATLAKPLAAGLPLGATLVAPHLRDVLQPGDHGSTFGGGPLVCRAAAVFLTELQGGLLSAAAERGAQLRQGLEQLAADDDRIGEVRGRGLMLGLHMRSAAHASALQKLLLQRRMLALCTAGDVLRMLPPFIVTAAQIDDGVTRIRSALQYLDQP